ncbi:regulator of nucleoside diphosphate kinase [Devosia subaequoris]|uniref:Regulator of nucleoside diphosphate kinase n=1 Tax=Devosia subaequoris TaxID=395930 RepID=A0A7W6IQ34_9HYPH|nr:GreA/GreB family elongation factor [Devosia subaequoris]MBB4053584.1 regulator of nucleoside diphosphate kinase [Devosia subaequoris]
MPTIIVGEADRHDLLVLAMGGTGHSADAADDLLYELGRAKVVDDRLLPPFVVRMGSTVLATIDENEAQVIRLTYPGEASANAVSIFSPIGTALLGLRAGQTMRWTERNGKRRTVKVHSVSDQIST